MLRGFTDSGYDNDQIITNEVEKERTILGQDAVNQANATTAPLLSTANPPPALPVNAVQPTVSPAPDVSDGRLPGDAPKKPVPAD